MKKKTVLTLKPDWLDTVESAPLSSMPKKKVLQHCRLLEMCKYEFNKFSCSEAKFFKGEMHCELLLQSLN